MQSRRTVKLPNFHFKEGDCKCGMCGKPVAEDVMISLQAFIFQLERFFKTKIRCRITSGGRCEKHQRVAYKILDTNKPTPGSYHMGQSRSDVGQPSKAVDTEFEQLVNGEWEKIAKADIALLAIGSGLFNGVGHKAYSGEYMVHLDRGATRANGSTREW